MYIHMYIHPHCTQKTSCNPKGGHFCISKGSHYSILYDSYFKNSFSFTTCFGQFCYKKTLYNFFIQGKDENLESLS